jgi:hypothetical protein
VSLDSWSQRLSRHFDELVTQRPAGPIFALEHGLSVTRLADLSNAVRRQAMRGGPEERHALLWLDYAAELGYRYAGDRYWNVLADETYEWTTERSGVDSGRLSAVLPQSAV